ncbi:MAG: hypothetical protein JJT94_07400 [Bernardetiaceae bacterium]|nr:hypothetical protein [Bernardetiaceae bacterium]
MKIVRIFENLFAFQYEKEALNEYDKLFELWSDVGYLEQFARDNIDDIPDKLFFDENLNAKVSRFIEYILYQVDQLDDTLIRLIEHGDLDHFFSPLHNQEYRIVELSLQKGKLSFLRIYAIRIEKNIYVITGGAIKLTQKMQDRPHTSKQLDILKSCRSYLQENEVYDSENFFELITP